MDDTVYWVEKIYGNNYYYSGKVEDGKLVGRYVSDGAEPGKFSIHIG
jgi:hypothetical protein